MGSLVWRVSPRLTVSVCAFCERKSTRFAVRGGANLVEWSQFATGEPSVESQFACELFCLRGAKSLTTGILRRQAKPSIDICSYRAPPVCTG
ncbi:hypothetical protein Poly21_12740 [Allorhodopirellula heiligendammensis]|uniref:Uncharacterized protein n=1 Tax=Allorhodopirellula heiligendammensis TaxID=2714739 RepID=A0A5C6C3L8_9BACT|nr:hypothetical protein Poly21_12740 [Allorhodopirellula heiligendammensis]